MLKAAIDLQNNAVADLEKLLATPLSEITFRAPTGAGKTHMMAQFMNDIIGQNSNAVFIVSSLSKGDLATQNYDRFAEYNETEFKNIDPFLISSDKDKNAQARIDIEQGHNVYVLPRDLYKKGGRLKTEGAFIGFLEDSVKAGKQIYLIKDECHIATKNLDELSRYFIKTINFSATPKLSRGQRPDVNISDTEAVKAKLIKRIEYMDYYDDNNQEESLDKALEYFEKKREEYINKETGVNPCFIIQISNKEKADDEWKMIRKVLEQKHGNLKWMLIVQNGTGEESLQCNTNDEIKDKVPVNQWKNYAKGNMSTISVIVFKMVISEGWDIPRACMLYQIRDSKSEQLDEQVVGRVRRNPVLLKYNYDTARQYNFAMTAHIWGLKAKTTNEVVNVRTKKTTPKITDELQVKTTCLTLLDEQDINVTKVFDDAVNKYVMPVSSPSIFDLFRNYSKADYEVQKCCEEYVTNKNMSKAESYQNWFAIMKNIKPINVELNEQMCDYSKSMIEGESTSVPERTFYEDKDESNPNKLKYHAVIQDWLWQKQDPTDNIFGFDSEAEKKWAYELSKISRLISQDNTSTAQLVSGNLGLTYLWGKNYLDNSNIGYEYYLHGIHTSYPDFILKDRHGKIHMFETKSLNESSLQVIDGDAYQEKVAALKKCYLHASRITGHHFWIPVQNGDDWDIFHYADGTEEQIDLNRFEQIMME